MKALIGRIVRKKEQSSPMASPPRYSRLSSSCGDEVNPDNPNPNPNPSHRNHGQARKGYVPVLVGKCYENEERFMVPLKWMNHPCVVALLQLSSNEFGFSQEGVIQIPCEPHHFRVVIETISGK